jgi:ketosteroid isomerase-like protein
MKRSLRMQASRLFLFDAPLRPGLPSGTKMRRHPAPRLALIVAPPALAAFVLMAACNSAWALPHREKSEIHKEIEALELQWQQAVVTHNVGAMDRLLADDYIGITSNGTVETKQQAVDQQRAGTVRITKLNLTDTHVRVYGDTAVVTSLADLVGTNGATDITGQYRYTRVYNRRVGQWKIVSFEASRAHDVDARAGKIKP